MRENMAVPIFHFTDIRDGMGEKAVVVDDEKYCDECNQIHEFEKCPKCGSWIHLGFGLQFGGYGPYKWCQNDDCDWFYKEQIDD